MKTSIHLVVVCLRAFFLADCSKKEEPILCYTIQVLSGNMQVGAAGQRLSEPLKVKVVHPNGGVAATIEVWWFVNYGGGTANPAFSKTDANGIASTEWILGQDSVQNVNANVNNLFTCTTGQNFALFGATLQ